MTMCWGIYVSVQVFMWEREKESGRDIQQLRLDLLMSLKKTYQITQRTGICPCPWFTCNCFYHAAFSMYASLKLVIFCRSGLQTNIRTHSPGLNQNTFTEDCRRVWNVHPSRTFHFTGLYQVVCNRHTKKSDSTARCKYRLATFLCPESPSQLWQGQKPSDVSVQSGQHRAPCVVVRCPL